MSYSLTIDEMRSYITSKYESNTWRYKVERMPENQVIAVYYSFLERETKKKLEEEKKAVNEQLDWFDVLKRA